MRPNGRVFQRSALSLKTRMRLFQERESPLNWQFEMKSELTSAERNQRQMQNYQANRIAAFTSFLVAAFLAYSSSWMALAFLFFSAWQFRLMHLSGFKKVPDSQFSLPKLFSLFTTSDSDDFPAG